MKLFEKGRLKEAKSLTDLLAKLKEIYGEADPQRKNEIIDLVKKYGYLPYPHIKALKELTPAETIAGIEEKFKLNNVYNGNEFNFTEISPVKRAGFNDSSWVKTEQHTIKLINLAGLGNGNESKEPGRFIDWLKQLLILPSGNVEKGVLGTTAYLIPFHPRNFGCAYLPTSSEVSPNLEDKFIAENLGLNVKEQVQLFLLFAQLSGHPTMYDVLPQTGRFSKTVLAKPYIARWYDINDLISRLTNDLDEIREKLKQEFHWGDVEYVKGLIAKNLKGNYQTIKEEHHKQIEARFEEELDSKRKWYSNEMLTKQNQENLLPKVKSMINKLAGFSENASLTEEDIKNQDEIIGELIKQGFWPAPGGAWNSCGIPVFDKMSRGAGHPLFKHYDIEGNDVTHFANLDCQTPYYFVYLETGEYNEKVIDFYVEFLKKIQSDYNFDSFRVDHIDHIVDKVSETPEGRPISYRAPRCVLGKANSELKKSVPHFATLAEYMLWDMFLKEYHLDMNFDLLWGSDIVSQYLKNVEEIISDNKILAEYNATLPEDSGKLGILKTYNNQDGEFRAIDQYPGQLGEDGALFKLFKFKFIPGGKLAQRPVLHIDGDESFTKTGIEHVIGVEESMKRASNKEFYRKFNAITSFAAKNDLTRYGIAEIHAPNNDKSGFVSWYIRSEFVDNERLLIVANETAPTEIIRDCKEDGTLEIINKVGEPVYNREIYVPEGFKVAAEYILEKGKLEFTETTNISGLSERVLQYEKLEPCEYRIYKLVRV